MKLYLDIKEVRNDERVSILMEELTTSVETQKAVNDLVERIVQCANSHIWGTLIMMVQESENSAETIEE